MATFRVFAGRDLVGEFFFDEGPLIIGRGQEADIYVKQDVISRRHAVVKKTGTTWTIENIGGKNGLFVNGAYTGFKVLAEGDRIELGRAIIQFSPTSPASPTAEQAAPERSSSGYFRSMNDVMALLDEAEDDDIASIKTTRSTPPRPIEPEDDEEDDVSTVMLTVGQLEAIHTANVADQQNHLSWFDENNKHQYLPLTGEPVVLGRGAEAQVPVRGGIGIGNRFALISQDGGEFYVERCSRLASVKLNGLAVKAPVPLQDGDKIKVYDSLIVFRTGLFD